jgi:membrane associated rhomboid family serine protease
MSSGPDLFVVCKQCGSEVSPYITECPYCGHRLRRRAPKLPREHIPGRPAGGLAQRLPRLLRRSSPTRSTSSGSRPEHGRFRHVLESGLGSRPYATIALVAASCAVWVVWHAKPVVYFEMAIIGPLHGDWWKLFTYEFAYFEGWYAFVAIVAIALFGWLLERRHGPVVVLALFLAAGATGALVASAVYSGPVVSGGNAAALALLAAWAAPDLQAARAGSYYVGDLLGAGAIAALLLAIPFGLSSSEASWLAGVTGGALGLVLGLGLHRVSPPEL